MFLIILRGFPYNHHISWEIFSAAMLFFPFPFFQVSAPGETFVNARRLEFGVGPKPVPFSLKRAVMWWSGQWGFFTNKVVPLDMASYNTTTNIGHYVTTMSLFGKSSPYQTARFCWTKNPSKKNIKPRFKHHRTIVVSFPCSKFSLRISRIQIIRHPFNKSPWWCAVQLGTPWSLHWNGNEANSSKACQLLQLYALKIFTSWSRNFLSSNVLLLTRTLSTGSLGSTCTPCMWWATFSNMLRACRITGIHSRSPGLPGSWRSDMTWLLEVRESKKSNCVLKGQITSGAQSSRHNKCKIRDISTSCPELQTCLKILRKKSSGIPTISDGFSTNKCIVWAFRTPTLKHIMMCFWVECAPTKRPHEIQWDL